jgi:hypothetical protein
MTESCVLANPLRFPEGIPAAILEEIAPSVHPDHFSSTGVFPQGRLVRRLWGASRGYSFR